MNAVHGFAAMVVLAALAGCGAAPQVYSSEEHQVISLKMGELSLLPAVRKADADTLVVADGTSCRHQIADGASREALHVVRVLAMSVANARR